MSEEKLDHKRYEVLNEICSERGMYEQKFREYFYVCDHAREILGVFYERYMPAAIAGALYHKPEFHKNFIGVTEFISGSKHLSVLLTEKYNKTHPSKWMLCRNKCWHLYRKIMDLHLKEEQHLREEVTAKALKLITDRLERENVERAMTALGKDIADDKKESGEPRGL